MTKKDQIKIFNNKITANNAQYTLDRLNAKISSFSDCNLDKYEFLTRKDLGYKPNALQKARFEYSPLGKVFNEGLNKTNKKELLKDISEKITKFINDDNNDNNNNNDKNDDNNDNIDDKNDKNDNNDEYLLKLDKLFKNLKDDKEFFGIFSENIDDKCEEQKTLEELEAE